MRKKIEESVFVLEDEGLVEAPVPETRIALLDINLGRDDLNAVVAKVNEIIKILG